EVWVRATQTSTSRDARPGVACPGHHAGRAVGTLCGGWAKGGCVIEQLAYAAGRSVSRETFEKMKAYAALLRAEAPRHNFVSASTLSSLWDRHILDSAQLVRFEPRPGASWEDIGSGAGLPR